MLNNERKIPEVKFSFNNEGKSNQELEKELEELIKKRDELLAIMRDSKQSQMNENRNDNFPRQIK